MFYSHSDFDEGLKMSYDVHIVAGAECSRADALEITRDRWLKYLHTDPDMRMEREEGGRVEAVSPAGDRVGIQAAGPLVEWTAHPDSGKPVWFHHARGEITVRGPDVETLQKMHLIAMSLGAQVQGDGGECYDAAGEPMDVVPQSRAVKLPPTP